MIRAFRDVYVKNVVGYSRPSRVLEVGSHGVPGELTLRDLFPLPFDYTGVDNEPGYGVDVVLADPYQWSELLTESFDVVVSVQTFVDIPLFWITAAEIARVLSPGGLVCVVGRSDGNLYYFGPDGWETLCAYVGLDSLESYREQPNHRTVVRGAGRSDSMMVARKPMITDGTEQRKFYDRLNTIVATRSTGSS